MYKTDVSLETLFNPLQPQYYNNYWSTLQLYRLEKYKKYIWTNIGEKTPIGQQHWSSDEIPKLPILLKLSGYELVL